VNFTMLAKRILTITSFVFAGGALFFAAFLAASAFRVQDFGAYWAAAHLVRQDPYSLQVVGKFEEASGISAVGPTLVMRNPPWAIPFILPLGFFKYRVAFALWLVFSVVVVTGCTRAIWMRLEKSDSLAPVLLPIIFGPTVVLLMLGQWTVLVLLGITTFLIMVDRRRDWMAGSSLLLVMGKPHVVLLFLIVVILWTIQSKRWAILVSAVISLAASSMVVLALNAHIFGQFLFRTQQVVDETVPHPNLGGILYIITHRHFMAIIPQIASVVWLGFYWVRRREMWDWASDGMLVLLCSVAFSYYSYPYDEILVLPALVVAFVKGNRKIFVFCFAFVNIGYALYVFQVAGRFGFSSLFLWWTSSAWLITFLIAGRSRSHRGLPTGAHAWGARSA
jgi:Glycosyltransferase family 87